MFCGENRFALVLIGLVSTSAIATPAPMYAVTDLARVVLDTMKHNAVEKEKEKTNRPPPSPQPQSPPKPRESDEEKRNGAAEKLGRKKKWSYILV
jgi:hypothetical protein